MTEEKNNGMTNCNDCDYKNECDAFRYGDIIDLRFDVSLNNLLQTSQA